MPDKPEETSHPGESSPASPVEPTAPTPDEVIAKSQAETSQTAAENTEHVVPTAAVESSQKTFETLDPWEVSPTWKITDDGTIHQLKNIDTSS